MTSGEWIAGGLIVPVTPSKKVQADIDPLAWKAFSIGGKTWAYPYSIEAISLVYNKAIVKTPPKTFEEVLALDKQLQPQGKRAILWDYTNTYFTWPLLAAGGGYAFKQKADGTYDGTDVGVNNAGAVAGVELLNKLLREKYMPLESGYAEMEGAMAQGKVAMMINGQSRVGSSVRIDQPIHAEIAIMGETPPHPRHNDTFFFRPQRFPRRWHGHTTPRQSRRRTYHM